MTGRVGSKSAARLFHSGRPACAGINFSSVISKVENDTDKSRLINLQKVHENAKAALLGVAEKPETIDWSAWSSSISDAKTVAEIKAAYDGMALPSADDTELVEHPAWDVAEFEKLSASLELQNVETAAELTKLGSYMKYLENLPPVNEMTVDDVLGNNADLDYKIQRQMNELELFNVDTPERSVTYAQEDDDPRKRLDPEFPDSELMEHINAPARALATDILADTAMSAEIAKLGVDAPAFGEAIEGLLCQSPLVDNTAAEPVLDFSDRPAMLPAMFAAKFADVTEEAQAGVTGVFSTLINEHVSGAAKAAAAAKEAAVASAAAVVIASGPTLAGNVAAFAGADAAKWAPLAAKLLNVQSGLDELLAAAPEEVSGAMNSFVAKPTAESARSLAAAYSLTVSDVELVGRMVELLEAHVIQSTLYTDAALQAALAGVFSSDAEQAAAYAKWWPMPDSDTSTATTLVAPFDNVAECAASDAAFVKTKTIVTKAMMAIQ